MIASDPTFCKILAQAGGHRAGAAPLSPLLGGLLGIVDTLYFWFAGGRLLSADVEALKRLGVRARGAVASGFSGAAAGIFRRSASNPSASRANLTKAAS